MSIFFYTMDWSLVEVSLRMRRAIAKLGRVTCRRVTWTSNVPPYFVCIHQLSFSGSTIDKGERERER